MNNQTQEQDRYTSFMGLSCDVNADRLIQMLDTNISTEKGEYRWQEYFSKKRQEQVQLNHDNLNFVGHQTNTLYEYFASCEDAEALELLYKIEQQCC